MTISGELPPDQSPDRITGAKPLESDLLSSKQAGMPPGNFQSYMGTGMEPGAQTAGTAAPTPMAPTRPITGPTAPTMDSLQQQAKAAQDGLGIVEEQIHTLKGANVQMKRSQATLLKNKLTDVRDTGKSVAEKVGAQAKNLPRPAEGGTMEKFLNYIGDGQNQFLAVQEKLKQLSASDQPINPADMLVIQTKMSIAQQEIEYSSTLLGKVMTSMTTVMNIQL